MRQQRLEMFQNAFDHVLTEIDGVYKALTASAKLDRPLSLRDLLGLVHTHHLTANISRAAGGTASISLENEEEPFLGGIRYHAMPPLKRFRDMEALSGGEKTVAALALLFALHSYRQAPFFVLDEIDDALDNTNVHKVARFIDQKTRDKDSNFQCIVISLKVPFFAVHSSRSRSGGFFLTRACMTTGRLLRKCIVFGWRVSRTTNGKQPSSHCRPRAGRFHGCSIV